MYSTLIELSLMLISVENKLSPSTRLPDFTSQLFLFFLLVRVRIIRMILIPILSTLNLPNNVSVSCNTK